MITDSKVKLSIAGAQLADLVLTAEDNEPQGAVTRKDINNFGQVAFPRLSVDTGSRDVADLIENVLIWY
jgi:hypothetical protein